MRLRMWMVCLSGLMLCLTGPAPRIQAADEMTVDSAIECLADEDGATRKKAEDFLRAQGDKAIPALKKAMEKSSDPEIRKRAAALMTIAKRAPAAVKVVDQDGKPIAGVEFTLMAFKSEDGDKIWAGGGQVNANEVKPLWQNTVKSDDQGTIKTEELNQDTYVICVQAGDTLPPQSEKLMIQVKDDGQPAEWKIFRGATLKLKVVDENDKPLANAAVLGNSRWGEFSARELAGISDRKLAKRVEALPADSKTNADGVFTAKKVMDAASSLTVFLPGYARAVKSGILAPDGKETDLGVIKMVPLKKAKVTVTLVDKDMKPLKGLTVVVVDGENSFNLHGYAESKQLPKVLEWKYAHSAGPSDEKGVATVMLEPGSYAFAVANGESSSLSWVSQVGNGVDVDCGTVVLP